MEGMHRYLTAWLEEVPAPLYQKIGAAAIERIDEGPHMKHMLGLYLLNENQHEAAMKAFLEAAEAYPRATMPKLGFVVAAIEAHVPERTYEGHIRDHFIRELGRIPTQASKSLEMAYDACIELWYGGSKVVGIEMLKSAEVLAGSFYPALLLVTKGYGAVQDKEGFESLCEILVKRMPRLGKIARTAFSPLPF